MKLIILTVFALTGCAGARQQQIIATQQHTIDSLTMQMQIYAAREQVLRKAIKHWEHCYQVDIRNR